MIRHLPVVLAILSLPVGLAGYALGAWLLGTLAPGLAGSIVMLFVPLLVAGLCMVPFLVPIIDRRAKADLVAIRARREAEEAAGAASAEDPRSIGSPGTAGRARKIPRKR